MRPQEKFLTDCAKRTPFVSPVDDYLGAACLGLMFIVLAFI